MKEPIRVGLISLGCAKNLVDAEIMLGSLLKEGVEITNDPSSADAIIVNTCSFIDAAQEESVDSILESDALREAHHRGQALIVSGCLPQRFRDELPKIMPEVDAFMGIDQVTRVSDIVGQAMARRASRLASAPKKSKKSALLSKLNALDKRLPRETEAGPLPVQDPVIDVTRRPVYIPDYDTPRFRLTPRHFAYLKIAEGCNHPCSFCTIPRMRGAHRSRPLNDVVEDARRLIADGVKELNLISQDSTYYGLDLRPQRGGYIGAPDRFKAATQSLGVETPTLCSLLRALNELPGDFWIRLLYTHPAHWTDPLIQTIAECPKVARYVDMPLQHIHDNMLERMRRETSSQYIVDLIAKIRAGIPGIALRTTFIVGFPGETEEYFQTLLRFIRETRFERLGIFTYSKEEGTRAGQMMNQIPGQSKNRRRRLAMNEQLKVARGLSAACVGRELKVLAEKPAGASDLAKAKVSSWEHGLIRQEESAAPLKRGRYTVARSEADAPDIDGRVFVRGQLTPGEFARVRIIGHTDYDLIAEPV